MREIARLFEGLKPEPNVVETRDRIGIVEARIRQERGKLEPFSLAPSSDALEAVTSVLASAGVGFSEAFRQEGALYLDAVYSRHAGPKARWAGRGDDATWREIVRAFGAGFGLHLRSTAQRRADLREGVAAMREELDAVPGHLQAAVNAFVAGEVLRQVSLDEFLRMGPADLERAAEAVLCGRPVCATSRRRDVPSSDERSLSGGVRGLDEAKFEAELLVSPPSVDRHGTLFLPGAWTNGLEQYRKNPVVLYQHARRSESPAVVIGRAEQVWVDPYAGLMARVRFACEENPLAKQVWELVKGGFLQAVSHGFEVRAAVQLGDPAFDTLPAFAQAALRNDEAWVVFTEVRLREISIVTVPSNPDATILRQADATVLRQAA
ncbi:MAG: hypothetical protein AMXMBFR33_57910 [Candidatus Xenobia bacterium]